MKTNEIIINKLIDDKYIKNMMKHLQTYLDENKINNVVIGISGGIDSSVSLFLLTKYLANKKIHPYFIDIYSNQNDYNDARKVANFCDCECMYINLNDVYDTFRKTLNEKDPVNLANLKSRLRMSTLYNCARKLNAIVISNANLDELYLGYFTKFGDGAGDYFLLANFLKRDIYYLASKFHLPINVINKKPTSGLYDPDIDDEKELKLKYEDIDQYLAFEEPKNESVKKIESLHIKNQHKLIYNMYSPNKLKYRKLNEKK